MKRTAKIAFKIDGMFHKGLRQFPFFILISSLGYLKHKNIFLNFYYHRENSHILYHKHTKEGEIIDIHL